MFRAVAKKGRKARALAEGRGSGERGGERERRERVAVARTSEEGKEAGSSEACSGRKENGRGGGTRRLRGGGGTGAG